MTTRDMIRALGKVIEEYKNKPVFTGQTDIPIMCRAVIDKLKELSEPWHTGTPTEEGWYLVAFNYESEEGVRYTTDYFKDGKWAFPMVRDISKVVKWQKIEEKEDGQI